MKTSDQQTIFESDTQDDSATKLGGSNKSKWLARNVSSMKTLIRVLFGVIWGIDGALKFQPGLIQAFPSMMSSVTSGQPSFLAGWFSFWSSLTLSNPAMFIYTQGILEISLSAA